MLPTTENGKRYLKIFLFSLLALVLLGVLYFFYNAYTVSTNTLNHSERDFMFATAQNSTPEYLSQVIQTLDERIKNATTESDRLAATLEKGFVVAVNRGGDDHGAAARGSSNLFTSVYEATKNSSDPLYKVLKEKAVSGYVFSFVQNNYSTEVLADMSPDLKNAHFNYFSTEQSKTASAEVQQKEAFKGMISLVDDGATFATLKDDKSLNSNSAMIKAVYLDSFKDQMTKGEIGTLASSTRKDVDEYTNGKIRTAGAKSIRLTMLAPMHVAFADYVIKKAMENKTDYSELEKAYANIQGLSGDEFGKTLISSQIKMYIVGILSRGKPTEKELAAHMADIESQLQKMPAIQPTLKGYLEYRLTAQGKWQDIYQNFFTLAHKSTSVKNFLNGIGLTGW